MIDRVRWWSCRRQLLGGVHADNAAAALQNVLGVYSSHPSGPLSLAARVDGLEPDSFRALETDRAAFRIPAMRGSIHLVPAETAARVFAATGVSEAEYGRRFKVAGISQQRYRELCPQILGLARTPVTVAQLKKGVGLTDHTGTVLRIMALEGLLLRVGAPSLRSNSLAYVATDAWRGSRLEDVDPDQALHWLAASYLKAYGPARTADLAWWAGISRARAVALCNALPAVEVGDGLLMLEEDADAFAATTPLPDDHLDVLPVWDAYTMGYAPDGRGRFVSSEHADRLYDDMGNGLGVVLLAGRAIAAWGSRFTGRRLDVSLDRIEPLATPIARALEDRFREIAAFLGGSDVSLSDASGPLRPVGGKGKRGRYAG